MGLNVNYLVLRCPTILQYLGYIIEYLGYILHLLGQTVKIFGYILQY